MESQIVGIPPSVYKAAIITLLESELLHQMIFVFGVSTVIVFSLLHLWQHVKVGRL